MEDSKRLSLKLEKLKLIYLMSTSRQVEMIMVLIDIPNRIELVPIIQETAGITMLEKMRRTCLSMKRIIFMWRIQMIPTAQSGARF